MNCIIPFPLAYSMWASEPFYRTYLDHPRNLAAIVAWMDRDLGDAGPKLIAAVNAHMAKRESSVAMGEFRLYAALRFAGLAGGKGLVRGLLTNAAQGGDQHWINDDPIGFLYAYVAIKPASRLWGRPSMRINHSSTSHNRKARCSIRISGLKPNDTILLRPAPLPPPRGGAIAPGAMGHVRPKRYILERSMRFTIILLLAATMLMSAEPTWRDYLTPPKTLGAIIAQLDRDLGDQGPEIVAALLDPTSLTTKPSEGYSYVIYAARRFAWLTQTPGYLQGLLRNAASGADTDWVTGDALVLMLAYASVKSGRPIDGVAFDAAKVYTHVPPKAPPVDPEQLDIK